MNASRFAAELGVMLALTASARADSLPPLPAPGEAGSHERYVEALRAEQGRVAAELLGRYDRRVAEAPEDRVAAMERCRFLGAAFYDPDTEENPREAEWLACIEEVETRFATDPDARVFAIEQRWGDEAVEVGESFLADPPGATGSRHLAAVHAHLARQGEYDESGNALGHAVKAMELDPSLDLRLLVARKRIAARDRAGARAILLERLEETREPWNLEEKGALLADLGASEAALVAFQEVERRGEIPTRKLDHARALAGAGRIEDARALYAAGQAGWASEEALRVRFEFELRHGSAQTARAAYDALRARGWETDPIGRERLALLFAHPSAAWRWTDASGFAALLAAMLAIALFPALFIVPIHGVGLLLARSGGPMPYPPAAKLGLRHAWLASAGLLLAQSLALLVYPAALDVGGGAGDASLETAHSALLGTAASIVVVLLVVRGRALELVAGGSWTWTRILTSGVLLAVGVQVLVSVMGLASGGDPSNAGTTELIGSVQRKFGLPVSLVCAALLIPLAEEIVFRGVLLSAFATRLPARWANAVQALLFGLAHVNPILTPALFVFGLVAGRLTRLSGSLRVALLAHMLTNALACVLVAWRSSA